MVRRRLLLVPGASLALGFLLATLAAGVAAGGMGCHAGIERDAHESTVRLVSSCMDPLVARVPTGGIVTFVNADPQPHAITGGGNRWGSWDEIREGESVAYRFTRAGVYPYFCYLHPGMIGAVLVGDGGPDGTGDSVLPVAPAAAAAAAAPATPVLRSPRPTPAVTPVPSATATAAAAAPVAPTETGGSLSGPTSLLTIGLLTVLLGAGAAYGFGLLPRRRASPR